ncbi:MAG: hypothetical protein J0L75_05965 [Spirochaetes bacterium]|nr:hypothetical protein [Spirochaetota bacterium]
MMPVLRSRLESNPGAPNWGVRGSFFLWTLLMVVPLHAWKVAAGDEWKPVDMSSTVIQAGSALDFSALVEIGPAGKHGRVVVGPHGGFAFENTPGSPVRFFGYDSIVHERGFSEKNRNYLEFSMLAPDREGEHANVRAHVTAIRRQGYNLLRLQNLDMILSSGAQCDGELHQTNLERLDFFLSCLREAGIYYTLDLAYHNGFLKGRWDEADQRQLRERLLLDPEARKAWAFGAEALLTHRNPYTGLSLAEDAALVSLTFWNEQDLIAELGLFQKEELRALAAERWRDFLGKRYAGSIERLKQAWGDQADAFASFDAIPFDKKFALEYDQARGNDAGLFLFGLQEDLLAWYERTIRGLGYKGLTHVYDTVVRLRNQAARGQSTVVAFHTYHNHPTGFNTPGTKNPQQGALENGGAYFRKAAQARYVDRPLFITENNFPYWGRLRHEAGLLFPAYASFQGFSGLVAHCQPVLMRVAYPMGSFFIGRDPVQRANEVLATLLFARRDVRPSEKTAKVMLTEGFLTQSNSMQKKLSDAQSLLSLLCRFGIDREGPRPPLVKGPREAQLTLSPQTGGELTLTTHASGDGGAFQYADAEAWVSELRKASILGPSNGTRAALGIFQAETGELLMDIARRSLFVQAPRTEAAALKKGQAAKFACLEVEGAPSDLVVALSSLDGKPIPQCRRMLLVVNTDALNSDFEVSEDRVSLVNLGNLPVLMQTVALTLTLRHPDAARIRGWALAIDGSRKGRLNFQNVSKDTVKLALDTSKLDAGPTPFFELAVE